MKPNAAVEHVMFEGGPTTVKNRTFECAFHFGPLAWPLWPCDGDALHLWSNRAVSGPFCRLAKPRWQTRYVSQERCVELSGAFPELFWKARRRAMCDTKWGFQTNYGHRTLPFKWQSSNGFHFYEAGHSKDLKSIEAKCIGEPFEQEELPSTSPPCTARRLSRALDLCYVS